MNMISYIYNKNEKILYTENTLTASKNSYIYPTVCVVRILDGSGIWQIGHELCPIKSGDLIFLSNAEPRRIVSSDGNIKIATFSFNVSLITSVGAEECLRVFYGRSSEFTHAIAAPELTVIYDNIRNEMLSVSKSPSLVLAKAIELLITASRAYDILLPGKLNRVYHCNGSSAAAIAASASYIFDNLTSELKISDLAKRAGMSTGYYSKMFLKYTSITPSDYIGHCRIKRFLSIFRNSEKNILDIAFSCGFTSSSGFYKTFHRICGCTPTSVLFEKDGIGIM